MEIRGLGYIGVGASDLADWTSFATNWLGMQMIERGNTARAFRMDDRAAAPGHRPVDGRG